MGFGTDVVFRPVSDREDIIGLGRLCCLTAWCEHGPGYLVELGWTRQSYAKRGRLGIRGRVGEDGGAGLARTSE